MGLEKIDDHLKQKLKDPYFLEMYELEQQKLEIVKKIIDFRIKNEISQRMLAEKSGVSQQHISKIESGDFSNIITLEKILLYIGYTIRMEAVRLSLHKCRGIDRQRCKGKLKAA
jgi:DNA-binding XRE family transcriptional regulator